MINFINRVLLVVFLLPSSLAIASEIVVKDHGDVISIRKNINYSYSHEIFKEYPSHDKGAIAVSFKCEYKHKFDEYARLSAWNGGSSISIPHLSGISYHSINGGSLKVGGVDKIPFDGKNPKEWKETMNKIKYVNFYSYDEKFIFKLKFNDFEKKYNRFLGDCEKSFISSKKDNTGISGWFK